MIVMIDDMICIYSIYWVIVFVYVDMIWIYVCDVVFIVDLCIDVCDIVDLFCFWYVMWFEYMIIKYQNKFVMIYNNS